MPTITITDHLNAEILAVDPSPASSLAKYFKGSAAKFIAGFQAANVLRQPLALASAQPLRSGLSVSAPFDLGSSNAALTMGAGMEAVVDVSSNGTPLFGEEHFGDPIAPAGRAYVSLGFVPSIRVGAVRSSGDLTFGFHAGTTVDLRCCGLFDAGATQPTVGTALRSLLRDFSIPATVDDLRTMPDGWVSVAGGHGTIRISASYDLATMVNPLATPQLPLVSGQATVVAGGSLSVAGSCQITGDYQIRVHKTAANTVRLGLYRKAGSQLTFEVTTAIGAGAAFGNRDLVKQLVSAIGSDPKADIEQLVNADLSDEEIDRFVGALAASINRSLTLALETAFSSTREDAAALLYEVDLAGLDVKSRAAVTGALDGDFTALTDAESGNLAGVTILRSSTSELRRRGVRLRLNLFGIVNVLKVTEFLRSGSVTYEPVTGDLNISDRIVSEKIRITAKPLEADGAKLRKAAMESIVVTAAYRASKLVADRRFTCRQSYFELHQRTNTQTMADNLEAVVAAQLATDAEKASLLDGAANFGVSTFLMETEFDDAAFEAMFLDAAGHPRSRDFYDRIGRNAMRALVEHDSHSFRHIPLGNDALWQRMRDTGPPGFGQILPVPLRSPVRRAAIEADYLTIVWWAGFMAGAAAALFNMRTFLAHANPDRLHENPEFQDLRGKLIDTLAGAVARNQSQFGDPWGLLAMDSAAGRKAQARAVIVSPRLTLIRTRP